MTQMTAENLELALATSLFAGFTPTEAAELIHAMDGETAQFDAGTTIIGAGSSISSPARIYLVLSGRVAHVHYSLDGAQSIVDYSAPGDVFGLEQAYGGERVFHNAAEAEQTCVLLRLFIRQPDGAAVSRTDFTERLLRATVEKSVRLYRKVDVLSQRSVREKLLVFLHEQSLIQGSAAISVPFNRQALADYLNVDRTTLSTELNKMRREGLIDFQKDVFFIRQRA